MEEKIWTVSEVNSVVKQVLEGALTAFWIEAEIGTMTVHGSGHVYLVLKDSKSQIKAVLWRGREIVRNLKLSTGMKIEAFGAITAYEVRGEYQFSIKTLRPAGIGDLQKQFEEIKLRLANEGLFNPEIKKPIPLLPKTIGVITSPTGAAIQDFLNIINRRFPRIRIQIYPSAVQGLGAEKEIIKGIVFFNGMKLKPDVLVITRGGGSMEDLWPFNAENLAREIRKSSIPVISAVGHEIDFTICDFASDLRVPTPSAAAELVITGQDQLTEKISQLKNRLNNSLLLYFEKTKRQLDRLSQSYVFKDPARLILEKQQQIDELWTSLRHSIAVRIEKEKGRLALFGGKILAFNPKNVLARGYSILLEKKTGRVISSPEVETGAQIKALLEKGTLDLVVTGIEK